MSERETLLRKVQISDFVMNDAALFLAVNPGDEVALEYYRVHKQIGDETRKEYTSRYGPLSRDDYDGGPHWRWVDGPWPWQNMSGPNEEA